MDKYLKCIMFLLQERESGVVDTCRIMGFMGHTKVRHYPWHCILALVVTVLRALIDWRAGYLSGLRIMETGGSSKKSKSKGKEEVDYDSSRFTGKDEERIYNRVWILNGAVIERELDLVLLENSGIEFLQNFTSRGWINLTMFKAESILTLCQEFMANIKYKPVTEKGKERLVSWVRGKKLRVTPDTFAEIYQIPREENPDFELPDIGMPDLATVSNELLLEGDNWDGEVQCNKIRLKDKYLILFLFSCHSLLPLKRTVSMSVTRAKLLWAIGTGKTIDLPRMMFMSLCAAYTASDTRGSVPFTGFLTELFKRSGVRIPVDLIKIEPERPIDRSSLSRSEGQRKKRRMEAIAPAEPSIGMAELKEEITNLRTEMNSRMTALEEESSRHTTLLQEIKGMILRMQSNEEDEDDD